MSNAVATRPNGNLGAMVGLDFFTIGWRTVTLFAVFVLLGACAGRSGMYWLPICTLFPLTTLTGSSKVHRLATVQDTLPVSRARVVAAMYLTLLLVDVGALVLSLAGGLASRLWLPTDQLVAPVVMVGMVVGILLVQAVMVPVSIKWGPQLGAIILLVAISAAAVISWIALGVFGTIRLPNIPLPSMFLFAAGVAVGLMLFALSWVISVGIYRRQDH